MSSVHYDEKEQSSGDDEDEADNVLDPRVKGELDRLNSSTAEINRLEKELEEVQETFRQTLAESAIVLKNEASFLGKKRIEQARPYYAAAQLARKTQMETQRVALKYERACSVHQSAKEVLTLAENKFVSTAMEHKTLDSSWQDVLNQAILKVMESEEEKSKSEKEHLEVARAFMKAGKHVTDLKVNLKSAISKSRPYFELKDKYMEALEMHKQCVEEIQENIQKAKKEYSLALKSLEEISDEIHEMRKSRDNLGALLNEREEGVGAEMPALDSSRDITRDDKNCCTINDVFGFKVAIIRTQYPPEIYARKEVDKGGEKLLPCPYMRGASQDVEGIQPAMMQEPGDAVHGDSLEMEVTKQEMGGGWSNMSQAAPEVGEVRGEVEGACLEMEEASQAVEGDTVVVVGSSSEVSGIGGEMGGTEQELDGAGIEVGVTGVVLERAMPEVEVAMLEVVGASLKVGGARGGMDGACQEVDDTTLEVGEVGMVIVGASQEVDEVEHKLAGTCIATGKAWRGMEEANHEVVATTSTEISNDVREMEGAIQEMTGPSLEMVEAGLSEVKGSGDVTVVLEGTEREDLDL